MTTTGFSNQILILYRVPHNSFGPKFDIHLRVHSKCSIINETSGIICYLVFCKNGNREKPTRTRFEKREVDEVSNAEKILHRHRISRMYRNSDDCLPDQKTPEQRNEYQRACIDHVSAHFGCSGDGNHANKRPFDGVER